MMACASESRTISPSFKRIARRMGAYLIMRYFRASHHLSEYRTHRKGMGQTCKKVLKDQSNNTHHFARTLGPPQGPGPWPGPNHKTPWRGLQLWGLQISLVRKGILEAWALDV